MKAMKANKAKTNRDSGVTLINRHVSFALTDAGRISKIMIGKDSAVWSEFLSCLSVRDELTGREYSEDHDSCAIKVLSRSAVGMSLEKRFAESPFIIQEDWHVDLDVIGWHLEITPDADVSPRSLEVRFRVPWPEQNHGTDLWTPAPGFPSKTHFFVRNAIEYGEINFGTNMPLWALYQPGRDVGFSVAKPLGTKIPRLRFCIPHWYDFGPELEFAYLRLDRGKKIILDLIFTGHCGCWRPALKWFSDLHPEFFHPVNPDVHKLDGGYIMTHPSFPKDKLKLAQEYGVKWTEIHHHFPYYGNYVPQESSWENEYTLEKPSDPAAGVVSPARIDQHCEEAMAHKIAPLLYFQCAGDGYIPYVEKRFPESIARSPHGKPMPIWKECWLMNSDRSTPFGQHIYRQIKLLFERYPKIEGIFLDQLCYNAVDVAHDDGVTMYANKPAYMLAFCYWEATKALAEEVHKRGKVIISNGPNDVEVQRYVDAHLAEAISRNVEFLKYLCLYKPLLFLAYYKTIEEAELMFQNCLLAGASYSINPDFINPKVKKLIRSYLPLVNALKGRTWILEPRPLTVPDLLNGNIFALPDGNIIITLVTVRRSIFDQIPVKKNTELTVRLADISGIKSARCLGAEYSGDKKVKLKKNDGVLQLTVPLHGVASVIILEK